MEADSFDSTHALMAGLGVSFDPATFDHLADSLNTPDDVLPASSSLNSSSPSPSPPLAAASEPTAEDKSKRKSSKKTEGLSEEEAREKRELWNKQERERQRALKIAFHALRRVLPDNSMSRHEKGTKIWILETAIEYIGELTIQVNRVKDNKDLPVLTAPSAPPMSANIPVPPMNPMPDTLVSQPLAMVHQNEQVPFFGQQNLSIDHATHHQPTVASKPEQCIYGSSNPTCLWGGLNALPQTTILQDHTPGPHSSHPMNVPIQTELYPGESHMGPRHTNGPPMMQPQFSAPSFSPYNLPALASSVDCPPMFLTPHGHFSHATPKTHLPSPAYPTPFTNRIMSDSGYSGTASSNTFNSSTNSSKSSKSRRRNKSTTFSPYSQDRTLDEVISFTYQPY